MLVLSIEKKREFRVYLRILANMIGAVGLVAVLASCSTSPGYDYTVGGTVSGMVGSGMVLQNNGGDDLSISANGSFSFAAALTDGTAYAITVKTQPTNPSQTCSVSYGSGTVNGAPVYNVVVSCVTGPTSVTVDPSGHFAYATNQDGTISAYTIDQTYGTLTVLGTPVAAGTYPTSVTVDPLKRGFAYAVDTVGGNIYAYTIETDGTLAALGTPVAAGAYPASVTVDPLGRFVYVANMGDNSISAYTIDSISGTLNPICGGSTGITCPSTGKSPASIITVLVGSSEFAYVANMSDYTISAYNIDSISGTLNPICGGSTGITCPSAGTYPSSVTVDQSGKFVYVANEFSNNISVYTIDQTYGTLTSVTIVDAGTSPTSIITVKLPVGEFAYVTNTSDGTVWFYSINSSDGSLTYLGQVSAGTYPASVTVDPLLRFAYVANMGGGNISVFKINSNGTLTSP